MFEVVYGGGVCLRVCMVEVYVTEFDKTHHFT